MRPQTEIWYCWKEFIHLEGEDAPRLITPWSDPHVYEYPMDWLFATEHEALKIKDEMAADEDWCLCKMTLEPL